MAASLGHSSRADVEQSEWRPSIGPSAPHIANRGGRGCREIGAGEGFRRSGISRTPDFQAGCLYREGQVVQARGTRGQARQEAGSCIKDSKGGWGPGEAPGAARRGRREGARGGACGDRRGFLQASMAQPSVCFRPQTRHPSPFKNKNKYLCCMLCVLGFSFLLEAKNRCLSASLRGFLPPPPPRPTPRCARPGLALWGSCQVLT